MVGSHAYSVHSISSNGAGGFNVTVRNPWGVDGYSCSDGSNDGFVTMSATQFGTFVQAYSISDV